MSDAVNAVADTVEEAKDFGDGDAGLWAFWSAQEMIAEREERRWVRQGRRIVKRYRDERPENGTDTHRFNILWSNVQTLIPTLYAKTPKAEASRRFRDNDPVGRLAAELLERSIEYSLETTGFDDVMLAVTEDRLLPGRGVARVLYVPHFGDPIPNEQQDDPTLETVDGEAEGAVPAAPQEREVVWEQAPVIYVFWEDYLEGAARQWAEVPWVRYRSYLTRDELISRFGTEKAKLVTLDYTPKGGEGLKDAPADVYKKAIVHETWDKAKKRAVWWAPGSSGVILDEQDDPLKLNGFFPNPNPVLATTTNDRRIPVPDYHEYQDQALELDVLTQRINKLTRALKISGVYAGTEKAVLQQLIDDGTENKLIPVDDWASFMGDKGGLSKLIDWVPVQQIAEVLIQLYDARDKVKQTIYEITGLSDILRGATDAGETFGAQQIKQSFAMMRIAPQQRSIARFARDIIRLVGCVIGQHFSTKTISMITGYPQLAPVPPVPPAPPASLNQPIPGQPPSPNPAFAMWQQQNAAAQAVTQQNQVLQQQFEAAVAMLRQDVQHDFKIDIEADGTIAADDQAEKAARTEFLSAIVPLLNQLMPLAKGSPQLADLCKEVALFAVRAFRTGRPLEETFEKAFDAVGQMPPDPPKGAKAGSPVDSPQDLALRAHEVDAKTQIAQQANAIKSQQVTGQLALEQQKIEQTAAYHAGRLQNERASDQADNAIDAAKIMQSAAESARSLT